MHALRPLLLLAMVVLTMRLCAQEAGTYYSFLSKCSVSFVLRKDSAIVFMDGRSCRAQIRPMATDPGYFSVSCGKRLLFRYFMDEGQLFVVNDRYQHGCEAAKLFPLHAASDPALSEALGSYLRDHTYVLDDTAALLQKAQDMNGLCYFQQSLTLLEAFAAAHPEAITTYLHMADAHNGNGEMAHAKAAYLRYRQALSARYGKAAKPAARSY